MVVKRPKAGGKPFLIFRKIEGGRVVLNTPVYDNMKFLCTPDQPGKVRAAHRSKAGASGQLHSFSEISSPPGAARKRCVRACI